MENAMKRRNQSLTWIVVLLLMALGVSLIVFGVLDHHGHWAFAGAMLLLMAAGAFVHERALRPGPDDSHPSTAERSAWMQIGLCLAAIMVLGGVSMGPMDGTLAPYLYFATYASLVVFYPFFRRRYIEENRRVREVSEDERDRAIQARGDRLSRRSLELTLVGLAVFWVVAPQIIQSLGSPLQIATFLLMPVLAANAVGESHVAWLYWRDRR